MKITLTIPNVSTNRLHVVDPNSGRRFLSKRARVSKEGYAWEAKTQYRGEPVEAPCDVRVDLYFPDKRRRDLDNIKALLDSMTGVLWKDDSLIAGLLVRKHIDPKKPRIVITFPCNLPE